MKSSTPLNGSDQLMCSFDYELRRHGFAGNQCQIILALAGPVSAEALKARLAALQAEFPMMNARTVKFFRPRWKLPASAGLEIPVRTHRETPELAGQLFNEPLRIHRGELMRFDLVERTGGRMDLIFTWTHRLMDATAAEHFLAAVGNAGYTLPGGNPQPPGAPAKWPQRLELMRKSVEQLDKFCEQQPRALKQRYAGAPRELEYRVEKFSAAETVRVRANGARLCGVLGDAQFHAVVAALELHRLHGKIGAATKSYILPMPVGLRAKGRLEPVFSNQVDTLMIQLLPGDLASPEKAVAAVKAQAAQAFREGSISYGRKLAELFSFLPMPVFMMVLKHGLKGEICSLFFGDTANVNPKLEEFMGVRVEDFTHVAAVTPSPGLGVVFYYFRGELHVSVVQAKTVLTGAEAAEFAASLRARLLNP